MGRTEVRRDAGGIRVIDAPRLPIPQKDSFLGNLVGAFDSKVSSRKQCSFSSPRELGAGAYLLLSTLLEASDSAVTSISCDDWCSLEFTVFVFYGLILLGCSAIKLEDD